MQQELIPGTSSDMSDVWQTFSAWQSRGTEPDADDSPFFRDFLEYRWEVENEILRSLATVRQMAGMSLDFPMDSPDFHAGSSVSCPTAGVKDMLPEIHYPHSLGGVNVFGIPFPSWMRIVTVTPKSQADAWDSYYFYERPDVEPYAAGLTSVPLYDDHGPFTA
ncbi:hypothetical protein AX15_001257 [Amanita polypyramis BW_CC]|nr:hypothetical protein AX15_001257 [Amanita polypyramis BW_CC]